MSDSEKLESPVSPSAPEDAPPKFKEGPVPTLSPGHEFGHAPDLRKLDADIESELAAAMGGFSDQDLYGAPGSKGGEKPAEGGRKKGKILSVHGPDVFVDVPGGRSQGVLPATQFPEGVPPIGTEVDVHIEGYDRANGLLLLSRQGAAIQADWSTVAVGMIVEARVTATNKGGLSVDVNGIRGFMPVSQIDLYRVEDLEQFVNQRLRAVVTEVIPEERNLVISRRALLEKEREENREKLWAELAEGQVREGIVRSIRDFGAFVDLGGVDGLIHVSQISWKRINDIKTVLTEGQTVKVVVLKIDREQRRVGLGLRQLTASPWDTIEEKYPANHAVKATITRLMDFGAFAELEPGVEGLIHISELAPHRVHRVGDVVQPGQEVQALVLRVDLAQKKISLSLKAALAKETPSADEGEEEEVEVKVRQPRTFPLRGGIGDS